MKISKSAYLQYFIISMFIHTLVSINIGVQSLSGGTAVINVILNIFCISVLLIAGIGLLGILLIHLNNNKKNIALRLACGASETDIKKLILLDFTLKPAFLPLLFGIALSQGVLSLNEIQSNVGIIDLNLLLPLISLIATIIFLLLCASFSVFKAGNINVADSLKGE